MRNLKNMNLEARMYTDDLRSFDKARDIAV